MDCRVPLSLRIPVDRPHLHNLLPVPRGALLTRGPSMARRMVFSLSVGLSSMIQVLKQRDTVVNGVKPDCG